MATKSLREWECDGSNQVQERSRETPGLFLWVCDGHLGHWTLLRYRKHVLEAVDDYCAGYDAGDYRGPLTVEWTLYQGGEAVDSGMHTHFI